MPEGSVPCCWPECEELPDDQAPLCETHFRQVGLRFIDERTWSGPTFREVRRQEDAERKAKVLAREIESGRLATEHRARLAAKSVVYYVRTGPYVKIGFTSDLKSRLSSLRLDRTALLATEPGGRALEAQRHAQFAEDRMGRREDFVLSLALEEHIRELQELSADEG